MEQFRLIKKICPLENDLITFRCVREVQGRKKTELKKL